MKTWKRSFKMLSYNFSSVILFEVIYKLLSAAVLVPALYATINYSIKLAGINFLSFRTIKKYLMAPTTYVAVLIVLVLLSIYFLVNISGIVYAMEASHRKIKINALQLLIKAIVNALRLLRFKNLLVMTILVVIAVLAAFAFVEELWTAIVGVLCGYFAISIASPTEILFGGFEWSYVIALLLYIISICAVLAAISGLKDRILN